MARSISEEEQILSAGYAIGDLSATEITQFESALVNNPELRAEVAALQVAFNKLPQGLPTVAPPLGLKAKILASFDAESVADRRVNLSPPTQIQTTRPPDRVLNFGRILVGIGLAIGGLLAFDNFTLRQELQATQRVNQQELASVLNQPKSRLLPLSSQQGIVGNVLFTPGNWQQVIVSAKNLPPLPIDRVYRMWLELADGRVIPCGEFKTDDRNSIFIKLNATQQPPVGVKAKGVFITIDRSNAPLQPTGERIIQGTI